MKPLGPLQSALLRTAAEFASSRGGRSLLVLIYHRVLSRRDPLLPDEPDSTDFAAQLDLIGNLFSVLPLPEAVRGLHSGQLPARAVCITFDDGYANNCEVALPLLKSRAMPATVFVAPGYLEGGRMFNDTVIEAVRRAPAELDLTDHGLGRYELPDDSARARAIAAILPVLKYRPQAERLQCAAAIAERVGAELPDDLMMTEAQIRHLHREGIGIGAHTVNHPILANADDATARREIVESRRRLEDMVGAPVTTFAYPNGGPVKDYTPRDVRLAREAGFEVAVSTAWGAATGFTDPLQIPRIAPWDRTAPRFGMRMVRAHLERRIAAV